MGWELYKAGIIQRFGSVFEDPMSALKNAKYEKNAKEYQDVFDTLLCRVTISQEYASSLYLGGLPTKLEMIVRMFKPATLADTYYLTNLQEAILKVVKKKNKPVVTSNLIVRICNLAEHVQHLVAVLDIMRKNQLYAKKSKCVFGTSHVEYLGHVISADGIANDSSKIKAVQEWPVPTNIEGEFICMSCSSVTTDLVAKEDTDLQDIIVKLKQGGMEKKHYQWVNEKLIRKENCYYSKALFTDWKGLRKQVTNFVRECLVCQRHKPNLAANLGLLQPFPIPEKWLPLAELWCNTSYHFAINTTLFDEQGQIEVQHMAILDRKMVKHRNAVVVYVLIECTNGTLEDATWERLDELIKNYRAFNISS
ncbi:putative mitochondrial protein [Tanacetum coccineum]